MQLSTQQLSKLVHNVMSFSFDENGSLHLHRFTKQQREVYDLESADWTMRTRSSASVTLDFITDSPYIALQFDLFPGSSQQWGSIDLYVDGVFCSSRYAGDLSIKLAGFELPEGDYEKGCVEGLEQMRFMIF